MENCYNGISIPTPVTEPCNGEYKSTDCILAPNALTYLGLPASSSQSEINAAIQASLMTKDELILEIDGSETKVIAGPNVIVTGTGTVLDPYIVEAIVPIITPVYRTLLTQNGLSSPVSNVLENTVGDNLLFSRTSEGIYLVQQENITNPLLTNVVLKQSNVAYVKIDFEGSPVFCFYINKINDYSFSLTVEMNDTPSDSLLDNMYMEFEIYN